MTPWESELEGLYSALDGHESLIEFDEARGIGSFHVLTITRQEHLNDCTWASPRGHQRSSLMKRLIPIIRDKRVVEIGAGIGLLARAMAAYASHVYAFESAPEWNFAFAKWMSGLGGLTQLHDDKAFKLNLARALKEYPRNLTWIYGPVQHMLDILHVDVAVVVTGSDEDNLRALAAQFAPVVVMPWQDWNDGRAPARVPSTPRGGLLGDAWDNDEDADYDTL